MANEDKNEFSEYLTGAYNENINVINRVTGGLEPLKILSADLKQIVATEWEVAMDERMPREIEVGRLLNLAPGAIHLDLGAQYNGQGVLADVKCNIDVDDDGKNWKPTVLGVEYREPQQYTNDGLKKQLAELTSIVLERVVRERNSLVERLNHSRILSQLVYDFNI